MRRQPMKGRDANFAFVGSPGAGKTWAARSIVSTRPRLIWIDPVGTLRLAHRQFSVRTPEDAARALAVYDVAQVVIYADHLDDQGVADLVEAAAAVAIDSPGRCTLVIDEWAIVARSRRPAHYVTRALRGGRHNGVSVIPITQRPADLHPDVRGVMDYLVIFRCPEAADAEHLKRIDPDLAVTARTLPDRHAAILDRGSGRWGVAPDVSEWYTGIVA